MSWGALVLAGLAAAAPAREKARAPPAWESLELSPALRELLRTGSMGATPRGFRIVALSFLADGCVAESRRAPARQAAARACVERCLKLANLTRRGPPQPDTDDGMWLTHYALILGAGDASGACLDPKRHEAISSALASRSLADPHRHVASYAKLSDRWPADQTATLASLARYDRAHGSHLLDEPARAWREYVLAHAMDAKLGLPWSEATGARATSKLPRGCALSFQTRFLHELDDELAKKWWAAYRRHYLVEHVGMAGFREWPPGQDRKADVDSGPIVDGVGAAASGLGVPAARSMGDEETAKKIERTAAVVGFFASDLPGATGPLPDAIRYLGAQIRP